MALTLIGDYFVPTDTTPTPQDVIDLIIFYMGHGWEWTLPAEHLLRQINDARN